LRPRIPVGTRVAEAVPAPAPSPLNTALLTALSATVAAVLLARGAVALAAVALAGPRARLRAETRAAEAGWIASAAQRWSLSPPALGGPVVPADGFRELTFAGLGLAHDAGRPDLQRTATGTYRLVAVDPCETLDGCAALAHTEAPSGALLVVGTDEAPEDAVAVLVLGPLVHVRLPRVPWRWIRELTTPATDPLVPAVAAPSAPDVEYVPATSRPQRERRLPSWRSPKPTARRRAPAPERLAL
jgi:hypothetical protein